jgi:dihydroflavonol-4-reductase
MNNKGKVLLTGITGFVGSHTTIQLLEKGYEVIGTLRNIKRASNIKEIISQHTSNIDKLTIAEADLLDEKVWLQLTKGADYVMHIASPFPDLLPKHEDELIKPAVEGTLNILKAASTNGVKKVVLTSSIAAIIYGKDKSERSGYYSEKDWTNPDKGGDLTPYIKSKTLAEKAAWNFVQKDPNKLKLAVINPGAILGPILEKDSSTSVKLVSKLMDGSTPGIPQIGFEIVDVRSVADLHIKAMESHEADGKRFICTAGHLSLKEIADTLAQKYPERKFPKIVLPNFLVKLFSLIDKSVKLVTLDLGVERKTDYSKAQKILNWDPIPPKEAIISCAESFLYFTEPKEKAK